MFASRFTRAGVTLTFLLATACNGEAAPTPKVEAPANAAAAPTEPSATAVVATVSGESITLAQVDEAAASGLIEARQQMYQARAQALDQMINERLLAAEAQTRKVSEEDLLKQEIEGKVTPPTDADIEAFYNQNQAMMRGAPLEDLRERIRGHLLQEQMGARAQAYITELRTAAKVKVTLEPPRIEVSAEDSPRWGSASAPIQIVEFSDFECPYCTKAAETIKQVKSHYGDKVSIVYRHFPLPMHPRAAPAAEAAECANEQGKFWEYHDQLFANQRAMQDADLLAYGAAVGLDPKAFEACLASDKHVATVEDDVADGRAVGMSGTPGFYINGQLLGGAQPFAQFQQVIDAELERLGLGT